MKKILLASSVLTILTAGVTLFQVTSCRKSVDQIRTDTVYRCTVSAKGLWEGTFLTDQVSHLPGSVAFAFYSDSTMSLRTKNPTADIYAKGTWRLANNQITFTDTTINFSSLVIQTGSFTYDSVNNILVNGKWKHTFNSAGGVALTGTFSNMQKVK